MKKDKLQLGCGRVYLPPEDGWLNVDYFSCTKADAYHDITNLPFEKESFSRIYICHVIEHLHRFCIVVSLNHWHSLLKPGGVIRISVPNFSAICNRYSQTGNLDEVMGLIYGRQDFPLNRHTVTFDEKTLTRDLLKAGFKDVKWWDWRTTDHAQFDDFASAYLPHMDKENGMLMSLNLQATKP